MDSEYSDSARTVSDQPDQSGARFTTVINAESTFLGRGKLDWLANAAASPPAPHSRHPSAPGHGRHRR